MFCNKSLNVMFKYASEALSNANFWWIYWESTDVKVKVK